jgi:arabinose-5-phosphate isomerase
MTAAEGPLRKFGSVEASKKLSRLPVASALRTLDLECEGLTRLREA